MIFQKREKVVMESQEIIYVLTEDDRVLGFCKDEETAALCAKRHMKQIRETIDEEEYKVFVEKVERGWNLAIQKMGFLWDGIPLVYEIRVQKATEFHSDGKNHHLNILEFQ